MSYTPTPEPAFEQFAKGLDANKPQLVWATRSADLDTPVAAMLRLMTPGEPCFLLESVEKGETRGRYSVIGLMPDVIWRCRGNQAEIAYCDTLHGAQFVQMQEDALSSFRKLYEASQFEMPEHLPPMSAGLVGYMAYDMVRLMEKLPDSKPDSIGIPDSIFIRPKIMVIFDAVKDTLSVVTTIWPDSARGDAQTAYDAAVKRIQAVLERLDKPLPPCGGAAESKSEGRSSKRGGSLEAAKSGHTESPPTTQRSPAASLRPLPRKGGAGGVNVDDFVSNTPRSLYDKMLAKVKEHILAGDIFQAVISQRFSAPFNLPPFSLYRGLRYLNPSPFLFYLDFCDFQLVGSSPEILVRLKDGTVTIRPIAGTRKRGKNNAEDAALAKDLLADPKELAEHLMLLDLGRNDVGRVAKTGTVKTTKRMEIENYSHVMHIVSNVEGEMDSEKYDALSALIAGFPAGTVSGAPKVRAMQIINELEPERRSFYAGCVGYFSANGNMDTCIALRTGLVKDEKLYVQAGGGIVADSNADDEYAECQNKAKALMRAAEEAVHFT